MELKKENFLNVFLHGTWSNVRHTKSVVTLKHRIEITYTVFLPIEKATRIKEILNWLCHVLCIAT